MKEKTFEAKFCGDSNVKFPFVLTTFKGKDGGVNIGVMMIDTGSVSCILNKSVLPFVDDSIVKTGKTQKICSMNSEENICQEVEFEFGMGNDVFSDTFYVNDTLDFEEHADSLVGIIGWKFLMKHGLTLDYSAKTLRSSSEVGGNASDYEFFYPMQFGIDKYNIPMVKLVNNGNEYVMVVDSGANMTLVTKHVVDEAGISVESTDEKGYMVGFSGKEVEITAGKINLNILSLGGTADKPKICNYQDSVQVINQYKYIVDHIMTPQGEILLPISGLLSSGFMQEHKWILDFSHKVMYSRK